MIYKVWFDYDSFLISAKNKRDLIAQNQKAGYQYKRDYFITGQLDTTIKGVNYTARKRNAKRLIDYYFTTLIYSNVTSYKLDKLLENWLNLTIKRYGLRNYATNCNYI